MTEERQQPTVPEELPEAEIRTKRKFTIIWLVPLVALLVGGWLLYKAWSEQGPTITIAFDTAEGLEAGNTKIKYKDVELGRVESITLAEDISRVVVTASMAKGSEQFLHENTLFWVVRARVAADEVSGLSTLLSGAYIGMEPSKQGKQIHTFQGLNKPPVLTTNMPGRHFVIMSKNLGSLDVGSPVLYRKIKVGKVVDYAFTKQGDAIDIRIFVHDPHHKQVRENTRFWNASGVDVKLNAGGLKVDTESLVSIMMGGIAFDTPLYLNPGQEATEEDRFILFDDRESIEEKTYTIKRYYLLHFDQTVRGLAVGAPVEFRGIKLGEVEDIKLEVNFADPEIVRIPVLVSIEPERIDMVLSESGAEMPAEQAIKEFGYEAGKKDSLMVTLVGKGLRAQLKTGNLLTGQLFVDLDFYPAAPAQEITYSKGYPVFPTTPAPFDQITESIAGILKNVEKIPIEEIGENLKKTLEALHRNLKQTEQMLGSVNNETVPSVNESLAQLNATLVELEHTLGPNSPLNYNANQALEELTAAVKTLRELTESLERDPQSLLFGKTKEKD